MLEDEAAAELPTAEVGVSVRPSCCFTVPLSHGMAAGPAAPAGAGTPVEGEALLDDDDEAVPPSATTEAAGAAAAAEGEAAVSQGRAGRSVSVGGVAFSAAGSENDTALVIVEDELGATAGVAAEASVSSSSSLGPAAKASEYLRSMSRSASWRWSLTRSASSRLRS